MSDNSKEEDLLPDYETIIDFLDKAMFESTLQILAERPNSQRFHETWKVTTRAPHLEIIACIELVMVVVHI